MVSADDETRCAGIAAAQRVPSDRGYAGATTSSWRPSSASWSLSYGCCCLWPSFPPDGRFQTASRTDDGTQAVQLPASGEDKIGRQTEWFQEASLPRAGASRNSGTRW